MVELVQLMRLPKLEEMFGPPRPFQRQGNLSLSVMTSLIAQSGQLDGIALALQDGTDDQHAGHPRDVADDLRQLDIHLLQGLLHVLDMTGGVAHLHLPLPPVGTQRQHGIRRPKRGTQEAVGMQALDPLRVEHVRLRAHAAPRKLSRLHQVDLEALRFQQLEQRDPIDTGGLQSDRRDAALLQPRGELMKIGGVGAELADGVGVAVCRDADHMHVGMDVDSGCVPVDDIERRRRGGDGDGKRPLTRPAGLGWLPAGLGWLPAGLGWLLAPGGLLRLFVRDDHGCLRIADACGETTRRRVPRGVPGTLEVSPTGSIPRRDDPAWQVTKDKVEASRAKLHLGQEAPKGTRPLTRVTGTEVRQKPRSEPDPSEPKFTGCEGAAEGGTIGSTWTCDISDAKKGEEVVLFLTRTKGGPGLEICHSGRGRMPLREVRGKTDATLWVFDVRLPEGTATIPGLEPEYSFIRSVELAKLKELVRPKGP